MDIYRVLAELPKPLDKTFYFSDLFAQQVADFQQEKFAEKLDLHVLETIGNEMWLLYDEHENEPVPTRDAFFNNYKLPLPRWVQEVQFQILNQTPQGKDGWNLDMFWAKKAGRSLGAHYDNDDVYTIQLLGSKHWRIDPPSMFRLRDAIDTGVLRRLASSESWVLNPGQEISFRDSMRIVMRPGDFLAMPAFALHHVITHGDGPNLSLNVGIRCESMWENFNR